MHIPEEARPSGSKLLPRVIEGRFIGYETSDKVYRIWNLAKPDQVLVSRSVRFPPLEPGGAGVTLGLGTATPEKEPTSPSLGLGDSDLQQLISKEALTVKPGACSWPGVRKKNKIYSKQRNIFKTSLPD